MRVKKESEYQNETILTPIIGLVERLPSPELEELTVKAIKEHRRLLEQAEILHDAVASDPKCKMTYIQSMIDMHAQMTVVSTLIDVFGRIPEVCQDDRTVHPIGSAKDAVTP